MKDSLCSFIEMYIYFIIIPKIAALVVTYDNNTFVFKAHFSSLTDLWPPLMLMLKKNHVRKKMK